MKIMILFLLFTAVFLTAVRVVVSQNEARVLFVEIQELEAERNRLNEEWTKLLLEQSTWATDARVEELAVTELGMQSPLEKPLIIIKP